MAGEERSRSRVEGPEIQDLTWVDSSTGNPEGTVPCTMHTKTESMDDVVIPDFHRRSQNGEIFNNPCEYTKYVSTANGGGSYQAYDINEVPVQHAEGGSVTLALAAYHGISTRVIHTLDPGQGDLAIQSARSKALSYIDSTPYAFLEDSLEIRETLRFLRNPLNGLRKLSRSFNKEVRKHKIRKRADAIADVWLEYRFAASPLLRSSMQIYDALQDKTWKRPQRRTARGNSDVSNSGARLYESANGKHFFLDSRWEMKYEARAGILYEVSNPVRDLNFKTGMRMKDIPEGLWAITPYSFMIDRVVDISGGIRAITNLLDPNLSILSAWTTKKSESKTIDRASHQEHPSVRVDITGDPVETREFEYQRDPWSPSISDVLPPSDLKGLVSDSTKILDLLALIYRNFR